MALIKDLSREAILMGIVDARIQAASQRETLRTKLIDFYESNQTANEEYLKKWMPQKEKLPLITTDLTKRAINRISMVYKKAPKRTLTTAKGDIIQDDPYNQFIDDHPGFNTAIQMAERYHNLLDNALLRVVFDPAVEQFKFFIEADYHAHFLEHDPLHPVGYSIELKMDTSGNPAGQEIKQLVIFDDLYFFVNAMGKTIFDPMFPDGQNPYGLIPIIDFTSFPVTHYWGVGAKSLVEANQILNIAELTAFYGLHFQSFDQPWISGVDEDQAQRLSPDIAWGLPDGANAGVLGFNPKLVESSEFLERYISRVLANYGLSANFNDSKDVLSGVALKIKNMELLEKRQADVQQYAILEKRLFDIIREMTRFHGNKYKIPPDAQLQIDFAEVKFPEDPKNVRDDWDWKFKNGLASKADFLMRENPDLSREEANKQLDRIDQENRQFRSLTADIVQNALGNKQQTTG